MTDPSVLSADRPSSDPAEDLFGHAPFARTIARAITDYKESDGIVLALYGPWGSGKSTVLAYIQHELESAPLGASPIVVPFNPWWFSGQENVAKAFLGQLSAVLPAKYENFRAFGDKVSELAEEIGGIGDAVGTITGLSFFGGVVRIGAKLAGRQAKDVPALKAELSKLLLEQKKRVLVVIDDIDRLTPNETRQLFTVIKALADFPYVTYLLAFDREVAANAISQEAKLPGDRYLEKIIQVQFDLPRPDRNALRQAFFARLSAVMGELPDGQFDNMHWTNIFHAGLDPLINVPRDIVRLTNSLSITYPSVAGEVNPVDFIAIEALRVFLPNVYDAIRSSPDEFLGFDYGQRSDAEQRQRAQTFHDGWLDKVPKPLRDSTKDMVVRLFPHLQTVWEDIHYGPGFSVEWRRKLRICAADVFPTYFRLSLAPDVVSRAEINALLSAAQSSLDFENLLLKFADHNHEPGGARKLSALLDRLMDHLQDDVCTEDGDSIVHALFRVADKLLPAGGEKPSLFDFGNESRVARIAYGVLKKLSAEQRVRLLIDSLDQGSAARCSQYLIISLAQEAEGPLDDGAGPMVSAGDVQRLKAAWCSLVDRVSVHNDLIDHPSLGHVLSAWRAWGEPTTAISWWQTMAVGDEQLIKLIAAEASESRSQSDNDLAWRTQLRVDPRRVQPYGDIHLLADRVRALLDQGVVADKHAAAAEEFVRTSDRMREGLLPYAD